MFPKVPAPDGAQYSHVDHSIPLSVAEPDSVLRGSIFDANRRRARVRVRRKSTGCLARKSCSRASKRFWTAFPVPKSRMSYRDVIASKMKGATQNASRVQTFADNYYGLSHVRRLTDMTCRRLSHSGIAWNPCALRQRTTWCLKQATLD